MENGEGRMKLWMTVLLVVSVLVLAGCEQTAPAQVEDTTSVNAPADTTSAGAPADTSSGDDAAPQKPGGDPAERSLDGTNLLNLGTLNLEGTENAVTPEQAAKLLPFWEMIASDAVQGAAETEASSSRSRQR